MPDTMTLIVAFALVTGAILILSAIQNWTIQQTVQNILHGTVQSTPPTP